MREIDLASTGGGGAGLAALEMTTQKRADKQQTE
jgi:hypothetical protein